MNAQTIDILRSMAALFSGAAIGWAFGLMQQAARRRNEKLAAEGKLPSKWSVMPGSGGRVTLLLLTLALIQIICPMLFVDSTQWWVSGGLVAAYGVVLFQQLRRRRLELLSGA